MAHFAQIDENNVVVAVNVIHNNDAPDEGAGAAFCQALWGAETRWVQTSYRAGFRGCFAGIGYTYDPSLDAFSPPSGSEDVTS